MGTKLLSHTLNSGTLGRNGAKRRAISAVRCTNIFVVACEWWIGLIRHSVSAELRESVNEFSNSLLSRTQCSAEYLELGVRRSDTRVQKLHTEVLCEFSHKIWLSEQILECRM
jgi:hypothetical protein